MILLSVVYQLTKMSQPRKFGRDTTAMEVLEGMDLSDKSVLITGANTGIGKFYIYCWFSALNKILSSLL